METDIKEINKNLEKQLEHLNKIQKDISGIHTILSIVFTLGLIALIVSIIAQS